jgi:DNA-binding NarL/FixJ family response regulator
MTQIHITTVTSQQIDNEFPTELGLVINHEKSISDLYMALSLPEFYADIIMIDIDEFANTNDKFSTITTISTLLNAYQANTERQQTAIAILAHTSVGIKGLKEILCTDVKGIYPMGAEFTTEEKVLAVTELLKSPVQHVPEKFRALFKRATARIKPTRDQLILTPRQSQVLALIQNHGAGNKVIARMLNISESMVKSHVTRLLNKYGLKNRTQLALYNSSK